MGILLHDLSKEIEVFVAHKIRCLRHAQPYRGPLYNGDQAETSMNLKEVWSHTYCSDTLKAGQGHDYIIPRHSIQ